MIVHKKVIKAIRIDSYTGEPKVIDLEITISDGDGDPEKALMDFNPGVTGFESFYMKTLDIERHAFDGMWPCAGTRNRWDELYIFGWTFEKLMIEFGLLKPDWIQHYDWKKRRNQND